MWVTKKVAQSRYDICKKCDKLLKATAQCRKCGCFMKFKVKMQNANCLLGKW